MPSKAKKQSSQLIRTFVPYKESKGEEYMSEKMRAHFTEILNSWKQELMETDYLDKRRRTSRNNQSSNGDD